ncbi:MAG TPA: hypothetical protein PLV93_09420 [Microthrixaceae bacterium]|nr:hypothetical protein [Microthrixaceae bacterium]
MIGRDVRRVLGPVRIVLAVSVLAAIWWASPASAHGGDAVITVLSSESTPAGVHVEVRLTYANDGDPIGGKSLNATATNASGVFGSPVAMTYTDDGRYAAEIPLGAGDYVVSIASFAPEVSIEFPITHIAPTSEPPTSEPTSTEPTASASTLPPRPTTTASSKGSGEGDESSALPWLLGGGVVIAGGAGAFVRSLARRR